MIYLIEDDENIRKLVTYTLNSQGMECEGFERAKEFWKQIEKKEPELILLDIMLPGEDGMEILKKLKKNSEWQHIPVIMLTAKSSEYDKVLGLNEGADDYVTKPFGMMELLARVNAVLRRSEKVVKGKEKEYYHGILYVNPKKHLVKVNEEEIILTLKEYEILNCLIENKEIVFTRSQLLDKVWGYSFDGETRTVDVHIRSLRKKLKDAGNYIETVKGVGYKLGGKVD